MPSIELSGNAPSLPLGSTRLGPASQAASGRGRSTLSTVPRQGEATAGAAARKDAETPTATNAGQTADAIGTQLVLVFDDQTHTMTVKLLDIETQKVEQPPAYEMPASPAGGKLPGQLSSGALVDTKA